MSKCLVQLHLDHKTGQWWAHCTECRFSAAASRMLDIKRLVREGHGGRYRLDLCIDNAPPRSTATSTETIFDWALVRGGSA